MKQIVLIFFLLLTNISFAQTVLVKGFVLPPIVFGDGAAFFGIIAVENKFTPNCAVELEYQNFTTLGDNDYFKHRFYISFRHYFTSDKKFVNNIFLSPRYRFSYIKQIPDQSDEDKILYRTHSMGIEVGKQITLNKKWIFEMSPGPYYFLSDDNDANTGDHALSSIYVFSD